MVDLLRTIKNALDAHGAWLFGGAVAAGLVARRAALKRSSFGADWFQVTCYGCGRSGFSDEFAEVTAPDGRDAYRCVRCDRPDLFRQAEGESFAAEATNPCQHCEGAAGFPREFYYQTDRIDMVPCGTCLTQGRCPGCMEVYPGLTRDVTPEQVFLGTGCTRCGYSESDAREARRTARRWADLVDNPAAARFMAEDDDTYQECPKCGVDDYPMPDGKGGDCWYCTWYEEDKEDDDTQCHCRGFYKDEDSVCPRCKVEYVCGCKINNTVGWGDGDDEDGVAVCHNCAYEVVESWDAEDDYGVGAVWMSEGPGDDVEWEDDDDDDDWTEWNAERYDPNTHGAFLPAGSVKRFLSTIPLRTPFFVEFQKSNGDLRSMNAIFTKPFDADGMAAGVLEVFPGDSSKRSSFKRFRVDRVVTLYRL